MKLFTPGPVNLREEILEIGSQQQPYFRTAEFAKINFENEQLMRELIGAPEAKFIPLTASGTGAMDAVASNLLSRDDNILVINGGTFGERWVELCAFYGFKHIDYKVPFGKNLNLQHLRQTIESEKITVILTQGTETSSGQAHPIREIGEIVKEKEIFFVVDAITAFLADPYNMDKLNIDITVLSSQKGFTLPIGMSYLMMNSKAIERCNEFKSKSYYFDLKKYINDLNRGQTPFSPAITLIYQLNAQLKYIKQIGLNNHIENVKKLATDFREKAKDLPVDLVAENPSNCITTLRIRTGINVDAYELFNYLKDRHQVYITPVGGKYASTDFRISHLGDLTIDDNQALIDLIKEYFAQRAV